jgi:hypothetical protein
MQGVKDRAVLSIFWPVIALSAWLAFSSSLGGSNVAAKKSIVLLITLSALYLLGLIAFDLEALSHSEGADSFEAIQIAIMNNLCCHKHPDAELDTEAGRSSRKQMMRDGLVILVFRAHSQKYSLNWLLLIVNMLGR